MIVYHGSEKIIQTPVYKGSRNGTDFGSGFYCTENLQMAKSWCALRNGTYVNKYELNLEGLKVKENEMLNLSMLNDKVFKARRNSNKDMYYQDLQES